MGKDESGKEEAGVVGKVEVDRASWTLHLMVGLPYSGKTTLARQMGFPIVSPDAIRVALHGQRYVGAAEPFVWAIAYAMAEALFLAGHKDVVIDATNCTEPRRSEWKRRYPNVLMTLVLADPETCRQRAKAAGDIEILPVIDRMAAEWDVDVPWKPLARPGV